MVDESSKRIYIQKTALKLLHKFDLCIFSYNLYMFATFHEPSYDYFDLCRSSVYVLSNIMMQTFYFPFLSWCHSFREYIQCVKTGEGSLLETLIAITGKSTPISGGRESPLAMKLMWLWYAILGDVKRAYMSNFNSVRSFFIIQRAHLEPSGAGQEKCQMYSLTWSPQLIQNALSAIFSCFSRALQVLRGVQHPAHHSCRALGPNSSTWWRHTVKNLIALASLCSQNRRISTSKASIM